MADNSVLVPNSHAVSSDCLFNLKPSAVRSRSYRANILPTNKNTFNPGDLAVFYIPGGRRNTYMDPQQSFLRMTVKNNDSSNMMVLDNNFGALINRLDIFHASNLIETIQQYNVLWDYVLDCQLNESQKKGYSSSYGFNPNSSVTISGSITTPRCGAVIAKSTQVTGCFPILSGSVGLGCDKFIPIGQMADDIRLEFTFENLLNSCVYIADTASTTTISGALVASESTASQWTVTNMELCIQIIELSDEGQAMVESVTPFDRPVYLHGNSWRHMMSTLPSASSGMYSTLVGARFASLKTMHVLPRRASELNTTNSFSLASRVNPNFSQYWWRIGAYIIPQKSVNLINASTTGGYGEGFIELQKAWHALNHPEYASSLPFNLYNVADAADTTVGNGGVTVGGSTSLSINNAFALATELETFAQRNDVLLSGMNTLASQVFFEANISTALSANNYTLDFYANYDHILVLQDGILSVRF